MTFLDLLRNLLNPKVKRPTNCICREEEFRWFDPLYDPDCPCHGHHITSDELGSKCKQEE